MTAGGWNSVLGPLAILLVGMVAGLLAIAGAETSPAIPVGFIFLLGMSALAFRAPIATIYLALLTIPFEALSVVGGSASVLSPTKLIAFLAAFAWVARRLVHPEERVQSMRTPLTFPLLLLLVANIPGLFLAIDKGAVAKEIFVWGSWDILFLAIVSDPRAFTTERLILVISISGMIVAAIATLDTAGQSQQAFQAAGQITNRASGGLSSPVALGLFITVILPLQLVLAARGRTRWLRLIGVVGVGLGLTALALALTRGAFLAVGVAFVWLVFAWRPLRKPALALLVVLTVCIVADFNPAPSVINVSLLLQRLASINSQTNSAQLRLTLWRASPRMIENNLPFGIGAKNFPDQSPYYHLVFAGGAAASNAHDTFLAVATEFGVPGVVGLFWLIWGIAAALRTSARVISEPGHSLALALTAVFLALLVDGITDYAPAEDSVWLTVMMIFALMARVYMVAASDDPDAIGPRRILT